MSDLTNDRSDFWDLDNSSAQGYLTNDTDISVSNLSVTNITVTQGGSGNIWWNGSGICIISC